MRIIDPLGALLERIEAVGDRPIEDANAFEIRRKETAADHRRKERQQEHPVLGDWVMYGEPFDEGTGDSGWGRPGLPSSSPESRSLRPRATCGPAH